MSLYLGKFNVLGITLTACDYDYIIKKILEAIKNKKRLLIAPIATHPVMAAQSNTNYRHLLNSYDLVVPDSYHLTSSLNFLYHKNLKERIYGPDLFLKICKIAQQNNLSIFLYGNHVKKLLKTISHTLPNLNINGVDITNKLLNDDDIKNVIHSIDKKADIICIGVGSPLQHSIGKSLEKLNKPVMTVGAAFDFISKIKPQAPIWMQKNGLEWLYRLLKEPRRLWKRYLLSGPLFLLLVIKQKIFQRFRD